MGSGSLDDPPIVDLWRDHRGGRWGAGDQTRRPWAGKPEKVSLPSIPWVGFLSWTSEVAASLARRGVSVPLSPPLSVSLGRAGLLPTGPQVKLGSVEDTWVRGFIASEWRFAFFCKTEAFLVFYFKSLFLSFRPTTYIPLPPVFSFSLALHTNT